MFATLNRIKEPRDSWTSVSYDERRVDMKDTMKGWKAMKKVGKSTGKF